MTDNNDGTALLSWTPQSDQSGDHLITIYAEDINSGSDNISFTVSVQSTSCCTDPTGDINNDGGAVADISDLLFLVDYMFTPGSPETECMAEGDLNGDGSVVPDISDLLYLVDYMFTPGSPEPANCQ